MRRCVPYVRGLLLWLVMVCFPAAAAAQPVIGNAANLGTFTLGFTEIQLFASGGTGAYTWDLTAGTLPPGVSLRTDRSSYWSSSASAGLLGLVTTPGTYSFTLRVTSGGLSASRTFTMKVTGIMIGNQYWLPRGYVGKPYAGFTFTPVDAAGPVTWSAVNPLPPGLSLSSSGVVSGTPTQSGSFPFSVRLSDGIDSVTRLFQIDVFDIQVTSPSILPEAIQNQPYSVTLTATGGTGPYTFSSCQGCTGGATNLPSGLQFDPATGVLSGTPLSVGPWTFELTVTDANHVFTTKRITIPIVGDPPALPRISPGVFDCTFGWSCTWWVSVQSGGRPPYTWQASGVPHGMSLNFGTALTTYWINPVDAAIEGIATAPGRYNMTLTVTDADGLSTTNTFPLNITPLHLIEFPPTPVFGQPYAAQFRIMGGPSRPAGPGPAVTNYQSLYTATRLNGRPPFDLTFNDQTFTLAGTVQETGNPANLRMRFTDLAGDTLDQNFNWFTPAPGNATLQITSFYALGALTSGVSFVRTLSACCAPSITWSVVGGAVPPGTLLSPDGQLTGTATTPGSYAFIAQAADAASPTNFARRYFTIRVLDGTLPFFSISSPSSSTLPFGNVGTPLSVDFVASGASGGVTWSLTDGSYLPPGVTFAAGVLSGTPTSTGQYTFTVTATDGAGRTTSRFFSLSIYPPGQAPPLSLPIGPTFTASLGQFTLQLAAIGGRAPYHYSLTPGAATVPGMRVQDGPPLPIGFATGAGGFIGVLTVPGVYDTSIRVTDADATTYDRAIRITVPGVRILTEFQIPRPVVGQFYSFQLLAYGGTGGYVWSATGTMPPGLSLDTATGVLSGIPTTTGSFSPIFVARDSSNSPSPSRSVTILVNAFDIVPAELPVATVGQFYQQVFSAPGCTGACTWSASGVPGGMTFTAGVLSGTPTNAQDGTLTVSISGNGGVVQRIYTLVVNNPSQLALSVSSPTGVGPTTIGSSFSLSLIASGGAGPYSWRLRDGDTLPPGMRLEPSGASQSSTLRPSAWLLGTLMEVGAFTFTLEVVDSQGTVASRTLTWVVTGLSNQYFTLPLTGTTLRLGEAYAQPMLAIGGTSHYTWTTPGVLPPGLSLNSATGVISGTPTNTGFFSTQIRIDDDAGDFTTAFISFNIASTSPVTVNLGGPSGAVVTRGSLASFTLTPSGGTAPYVVTPVSALPAGFVLQSGDSSPGAPGTFFLAGIPFDAGDYSVTLRVQDAAGNFGIRTFTFTARTQASLLTVLPDGSVGVPYSAAPVVVDAGGPLTWSVSPGTAMPPGLTLLPSGTIQGIPTTPATYSLSLVATGSLPPAATFTLSLRISPLAFTDSPVLPIATVGQFYSHTLAVTGATGSLSWSATGLPAGMSISSSGTLLGTPTAAVTSLITVTATDGRTPISQRFTFFARLVVPSVLDLAPSIAGLGGAFPDVSVGQAFTASLIPSGGLPPYTVSVAPGSSLPAGLRLFTPAESLSTNWQVGGIPTAVGQHTFDLIVTDSSGAQTRRTFTLNVSVMNLLTGIRSAAPGVPYAQQFTAVGGTAPYTFTMSRLSASFDMLPPGLTLSSAGLLSGTPQGTGTYSFVLRAQDSQGRLFSRTYNLIVTSTTGMLVNTINPADASVGTGRQITLSASGGGAASFVWSVSGGSLPPGMSLVPLSNGLTALAGHGRIPGLYTFTLRATDAANSVNFAERIMTARISPMQLISPPVELLNAAELPSGTAGIPYSHQLRLAGGTPGYTIALVPPTQAPAGLSLTSSGLLSGTPQQPGNYSLELIATDAAGQTIQGIVPLVIAPAGSAAPFSRASGPAHNPSVGVPYAFRLDSILRGGTAPYTWALTSGELPPGLTLLAGPAGIGNYLGGEATTAGDFTAVMTATDAAGRTLTTSVAIRVSQLALSPDSLGPAVVGVPYSVTLVGSGGGGSYTFQTSLNSDMPPGLSLSAGGVLSGTPTHPGNFQIVLSVSDAAGTVLNRTLRVTVDNALGESPAFSLSPRPVQILHVLGTAAPVTQLSVATTTGASAFDLALLGVPELSATPLNGTTSRTIPISINTAGLTAGTYVGVIAAGSPGTANLHDAVPVTLTVTVPPPCEYSINPPSISVPFSGTLGGGVDVSAGEGCAWTATVSDPTWIRLQSSPAGSGSHTLSYRIVQNTGLSARTGRITINGLVHEITQFGASCAFSIQPAVINAPAAGGIANIQVSASQSFCTWPATSGLGATPATGTGNGVVQITVPPNTSPSGQQLQASIAGQTLTVNQTGIACTASLSPYEGTAGAAGGNGSVEVTVPAGCGYSTLAGPSWINVTSGASGSASGTLVYSVAANSTTAPRSGTITIGGQPFVVHQDPLACSVTIDTSSLGSPFGPAPGGGTLRITTNGSNCQWTASADMPWVSLSSTGGTGNADITVGVTSNAASTTGRNAVIEINGQSVGIAQQGTTCTYALQSDTGSVPGTGGSGAVGVLATSVCSWTPVSNNPDWLTLTSAGSAGNGDVRFTAAANPTTTPRSGQLTIAGLTYIVTQAGAPCGTTLPVTSTTVSAGGVGSASFGYSTTLAGCTPQIQSFASWITVTGGAAGTVEYSVVPNPLAVNRVGTIQVGTQIFTVTELGGACGFSLHAYGQLFGPAGGDSNVFGSQSALGCSPAYATDQPNFILLGTLTGPQNNIFTLPFTVTPFSALTPSYRIGRIDFGGVRFTVKQGSY